MVDDKIAVDIDEVSKEALDLIQATDFIDMHIDTFIPMRLWNYDPQKEHGLGVLRGRFAGHLDFPRMQSAGLNGAMWSVTTNPWRRAHGRWRQVQKNFSRLRQFIESSGKAMIVNDVSSYQESKISGKHAVFLSIQGGNALDGHPDEEFLPDPDLLRVTLLHLTHSQLGRSSSPWQIRKSEGMTSHGAHVIEQLNHHKVFVDLAHIHEQGFWAALDVHSKHQTLFGHSYWSSRGDAALAQYR